MLGSHARWLLEELPVWVTEGILSPEGADRLRERYERKGAGRTGAFLFVIFGVFGAVLVAAGLILLLAHNWDQLSRVARTGLAFAPLLTAQALAVWVRLRRFESQAWREGVATFLALSIGGCIAMVGQIYQLPGSLSELLLAWSLLALPVIYLLHSRVTMTLFWVGITSWLFSGYAEFVEAERVLMYWLFAGLTVPFLLEARSGSGRPRLSLPAWLIALCVVASSFRILWGSPVIVWVVALAGLFGTLYALGSLLGSGGAGWGRPFRTLGALGVAVGTVILSYREPWGELVHGVVEFQDAAFGVELPTVVAVLTAGLILVAFSVVAGFRLLREGHRHEAGLALIALPVTVGLLLGLTDGTHTAPMLAFNAYGVGLGLLVCRDGLQRGRVGTMNFGLLLVSAVLVARFFDVDWSFVVRGVAFVVLGLAFLGINSRLLARRKEAAA